MRRKYQGRKLGKDEKRVLTCADMKNVKSTGPVASKSKNALRERRAKVAKLKAARRLAQAQAKAKLKAQVAAKAAAKAAAKVAAKAASTVAVRFENI